MRDVLLFISVVLASIVEGVEALTIVLAVGTTRGWRSTWYGIGSAALVLILFIVILGPALALFPINDLRLIVGGLLLIFGLQWLRKAILRSSGFISLHDEAAIFDKAVAASKVTSQTYKKVIIDDWYAFTISFKGVLLEGLEVAFIVVTFGASQGSIPLAAIAALIAIILVVLAGIKVHKPLSNVPENSLKFTVGIMLSSFGIFWGSEGAGIAWPGNDASIIGIIIFIAVTSLVQVSWLKKLRIRNNAKGLAV